MAWQDPHGQSEWRDSYGQYGQNPYSPYGPEPQDTPPPGYSQDPYGPHAQNPYAQNPYAQNPYAQDPYGQHGYAQDPYAQYNYGPPGVPARSGAPGLTIAALVANIASAVLCCIGVAWIPGIILAAMAMSRNTTDPESARKLTIGAWVCFVADVVLSVVVLVLIGVLSDSSHPTSTY